MDKPSPFALILSLLIVAFSMPGFSEEVYFPKEVSKSAQSDFRFWIYRSSEERHVVEEFVQRPGRLQDFVERKMFSTETEARAYLKVLELENGLISSKEPVVSAQEAGAAGHALQTEVAGQSVWTPAGTWTWDWELRFQSWLDGIVDRGYLANRNIATDCADVPISFRWIFARIHGLPMALRLAGTGAVFSHQSMKTEWASLPTDSDWERDQRFLAALDYVLNNTYTETLQRDTYPVAVSPLAVLRGGVILHMGTSSNHARLIKEISNNRINTWNSTIPRALRHLYPSDLFISEDDLRGPKRGGFRRFRWPALSNSVWTLTPEARMPYFSEEQYSPDFAITTGSPDEEWRARVFPGYVPDPESVLRELIARIESDLDDRRQIVEVGYAACFPDKCRPGSEAYETHSTPSRDRRIRSKILAALKVVIRHRADDAISDIWSRALQETRFYINGLGYRIPLHNIVQAFLANKMESNPNASLEHRWGHRLFVSPIID